MSTSGAFVDVDYGAVCLTLDFLNAGTLQNLLDEGKIFDLDEACVLGYGALQALRCLHQKNILHRDVKPSNFLVNTEGAIQLTDFGITKVFTLVTYPFLQITHLLIIRNTVPFDNILGTHGCTSSRQFPRDRLVHGQQPRERRQV